MAKVLFCWKDDKESVISTRIDSFLKEKKNLAKDCPARIRNFHTISVSTENSVHKWFQTKKNTSKFAVSPILRVLFKQIKWSQQAGNLTRFFSPDVVDLKNGDNLTKFLVVISMDLRSRGPRIKNYFLILIFFFAWIIVISTLNYQKSDSWDPNCLKNK